jgi:hypothetical protein
MSYYDHYHCSIAVVPVCVDVVAVAGAAVVVVVVRAAIVVVTGGDLVLMIPVQHIINSVMTIALMIDVNYYDAHLITMN